MDAKTDSTLETQEQAGSPEKTDLDTLLDKSFEKHYSKSETKTSKSENAPDKKVEEITAKNSDKQSVKTDSTDNKSKDDAKSSADLTPPEDWSAGEKEDFIKLPDNVKQLVMKQYKNLQAGYTKKSQELSSKAKVADAFKEIAGNYKFLQGRNLSEDQALKEVFNFYNAFEKELATNPVGFLKKIVSAQKIDVAKLIDENPVAFARNFLKSNRINPEDLLDDNNGYVPANNTAEASIPLEVASRLDKFEQSLSFFQQQRLQEEQRLADLKVLEIKNAKDEQGNLKFPRFDDFKNEMASLIQGGLATDIEEAYKKVMRLRDDTFEELVKSEKEKVLKEREEKEKEVVEKAKKAGSINIGSSPNKAIATKNKLVSEDDLINDAVAKMFNRA